MELPKLSNKSLQIVIAIVVAFGVPAISVISFIANYKDKVEAHEKQLITMEQRLNHLLDTDIVYGKNLEAAKKDASMLIYDVQLLQAHDIVHDEKIVDIIKETAANSAKLERDEEEIKYLRSLHKR